MEDNNFGNDIGGNLLSGAKSAAKTVGKHMVRGLGKGLKAILAPFMPYIIVAGILFFLILAAVTASKGIINTVTDYLDNKDIVHSTQTLKQWCITVGMNEHITDTNANIINPKDIYQHILMEEKSIPPDRNVSAKVETVTTSNRTSVIKTSTRNYTVKLSETACPYRMYYTMTLSVEALYNMLQNPNRLNITGPDKVRDYLGDKLKTTYSWYIDGDPYKYTKDVTTTTTKYVTVYKTKGGTTTTSKTETLDSTVTETVKYPLPFLKSVQTAFRRYSFSYKNDVVTRNDEAYTSVRQASSTTIAYEPDENGEYLYTDGQYELASSANNSSNAGSSTTSKPQQYAKITYKTVETYKQKVKVVEDTLIDITSEDIPTFSDVLNALSLNGTQNFSTLAETVNELPDSSEYIENLEEYGGIPGLTDNITLDASASKRFMANQPPIQGSWSRSDLIKTAMALLDLPYFWGGKYSKLGTCPGWGLLETVFADGNWSTGQQRRYGMDCSGFVAWTYDQMLIPMDKRLAEGTANQINAIDNGEIVGVYPITADQLRPGDLGFYADGGHVGMYLGKIDRYDAFIHCGGRAWATPDCIAGRVVISYNNTTQYYQGNLPSHFKQYRRVNVKFTDD